MILVELSTPTGPVFVNPAHVAMICDSQHGATVLFAGGEDIDVDGTAASVVEAIQMQAF